VSLPVLLTAEAEADLEEAAQWYEQGSAGLGVDLVARVRQTLASIGSMPEAFLEVQTGIRRAQVQRFPYGVFYRRNGDVVEVIAVIHNRRSPTAWQRRA
jgi:plasmid stabilization system protein ParE